MSLIQRGYGKDVYWTVDESYYTLSREPFATGILIAMAVGVGVALATDSAMWALIGGGVSLVLAMGIIFTLCAHARKRYQEEFDEARRRNTAITDEEDECE